jgi:hypothetical protein
MKRRFLFILSFGNNSADPHKEVIRSIQFNRADANLPDTERTAHSYGKPSIHLKDTTTRKIVEAVTVESDLKIKLLLSSSVLARWPGLKWLRAFVQPHTYCSLA